MFRLPLLLILALLLSHPKTVFAQGTEETSYFALPGAVFLKGLTPIYGVAAGANNLYKNKLNLAAIKSFGSVDGFLVAATKVPLFIPTLDADLIYGQADKLEWQTSYTRGSAPGYFVIQKLKLSGYLAKLNSRWFHERLVVGVGMGKLEAGFKGYEDLDGNLIELPRANLLDVTNEILLVSISWNQWDDSADPYKGYALKLAANEVTGRVAQSDVRTIDYSAHGALPVTESTSWFFGFSASDASVTKKETSYDTQGEVRTGFNVTCGNLTNAQERARCETLENHLVDFLSEQNKYGAASPLGGSTRGLRAYREARFKSAHSLLITNEFKWNLSRDINLPFFDGTEKRLTLAPFFELGYTNDLYSQLFAKNLYSYGLAMRAKIKRILLRLEGAFAEGDTKSVFFTLGMPL